MFFNTRIFGMADKAEDCIAGTLDTMLPIKVGHVHTIKGKKWKCWRVGKNGNNETLADFKLDT